MTGQLRIDPALGMLLLNKGGVRSVPGCFWAFWGVGLCSSLFVATIELLCRSV